MANHPAGIELDQLPDQGEWDCIVIGAGPAGSSAAIQLGRRGYSVVLIDKKQFPRTKVCGGCLSGKAVAAIGKLGVSNILDDAIALESFVMGVAGRTVALNSHGGLALSRGQFDNRLKNEAVRHGVVFLPETNAHIGPVIANGRTVLVNRNGQTMNLQGKVVLVCTGLSNPDTNGAVPLEYQVDQGSRIGLTAIVNGNCGIKPGTIYMSVDKSGYLGMVRLEDGRTNMSACVKQDAIQGSGSPSSYAASLIKNMGFEPPADLHESRWMGTTKLTRRLTVAAGERVFALGDAAKYLEPFTGEGIGWAIESSIAVQPFVEQAISRWDESLIGGWDRELSRLLKHRQRTCYAMKYFASRPRLVGLAIPILKRMPVLSKPVMNAIHGKQNQ